MRITLMILSIVLLFLGFEAFNIGGLISALFIYGSYAFLLIHLLIIFGLYKNVSLAKRAFLGENILFIFLTFYFMLVIPQLNFGTSTTSEIEPTNIDYIRSLKYGIIPLIFFISNIIVILKSLKGERQKMNNS